MITPLQVTEQRESIQDPVEDGLLQHKREHAIALAIFVLSFAYLCVFLRYSTIEPDEGIVLQGAERILNGQIPYRDFFSFYTPGSFYVVALIFKVFGDSFIVARASVAFSGAIASAVTYLLARRTCSHSISVLAAILATTCGAAFRFLVLHNIYSTLLYSLTIYAALRLVETEKPQWAGIAGSLVSLTFLVEQSKGVGIFGGLLLGFIILRASGHKPFINESRLAAAAIGLLWPFVVIFGYFGAHGAAKEMVASWFWPLQHYTQANRVPYGFQNWSDQTRDIIFRTGPFWLRVVKVVAVSPGLLIPVLPLIAVAVLCFWSVRIFRGNDGSKQSGYYLIVCASLAGLLGSVVIVRADILHFIYLSPLWFVVLAWILGSEQVPGRLLRAVRPYLTAYIIAAFGLLGFALLFAATGAREQVATRRGVIRSAAKDTVIEFVQAHVPTGGELLVYPYLPLYNYLTATHGPSPLDYFQPGMNTPAQAREIIASLRSRHSVPVLFEAWFPEKIANSWLDTPLGAIANDPAADYIVHNYRVCKILNSPDGWRFHYMVWKESPCP